MSDGPSSKHALRYGRRRVHRETGEVIESREFYSRLQEIPYEPVLNLERRIFHYKHDFYDPPSLREYQTMTLKQLLQLIGRLFQKQTEGPIDRLRPGKMQTRFTYTEGPMMFLGQQMVKRMKEAGYDAKIIYGYRSAEFQNDLYAKGRTKPGKRVTNAKGYESPHQYFEAVDIIHATKGWPKVGDPFWKALINAAKVTEETFGVTFKMGADWGDYAHIELKDWRDVREAIGQRKPQPDELAARFNDVLPHIWKRRVSSGG